MVTMREKIIKIIQNQRKKGEMWDNWEGVGWKRERKTGI